MDNNTISQVVEVEGKKGVTDLVDADKVHPMELVNDTKVSEDETPDTNDIEKLRSLDIDDDLLASIKDEDEKKYALINYGMMFVSAVNQINVGIHEIEKMTRMLVPEPIETLKILLARLEDIDPSKVDELSLGFIKQTFTVNGSLVKVTLPEVNMPEGVESPFDDPEFLRLLIKQLKGADEQVAVANDIKKNLLEKFKNKIPADVKVLLGDIEAMDDWMLAYSKKRVDASNDENLKKDFELKCKAIEDSFTLQPLYDNLKVQIDKKGTDSILHGYKHEGARFLTVAINTCHEHNITFPFQMFENVEEVLLGEKYKGYKNLFSFLICRYIKYRRTKFNNQDKIFVSNLCTHLTAIKRHAKNPEKYKRTADRMRESIDKVLSMVTGVK